MRLLHASENFPVFYHSTSFILSACGCCMGKGSYRNTKYKYVVRRLGADVWFSLWFLWFSCVCFVFYSILSKKWPCRTHLCGRSRLSRRIRYIFIWSVVEAHVTCSNSEWGYRVFFGPREHPIYFQGTRQHWLIFKENKGIDLILVDRNAEIWKTL